MSLYSKYRPQNFANLVGQEHIRQTILHEIQKGTLTHAYLFSGPRGTGKTSSARLIAKAINCLKRNEEGEPCDMCEMCMGIKDGSLIDVMEIDAASNRGIDEIRDLKEKIQFAPTRAKSKIYIIDEIHMLTKEAFNALLKTLEEPPENVYFILCTTEVHKIPETIISRCQRFDFKRIDVKTIMTRLSFIAQKEGIEAEDAAIELIAHHVEGGLRDAIGLFEQMAISGKLKAEHVRGHLGITGHQTVATLLGFLENQEAEKALHLINEVHREGYDLSSFIREILEGLRERLISEIQRGGETGLQKTRSLLIMIERFEEARDMMKSTVIPQLPLEIAIIKIAAKEPTILETKATPEAQQEEKNTAAELKKEYETSAYGSDFQRDWPRIIEHVQPPSLRRSLIDAKISEKDAGTICLTFRSRFHMDKANTMENRSTIEKAATHLLRKNIKIEMTLDTSIPPETPAAAQKTSKKSMPKNAAAPGAEGTQAGAAPADDLAKKAMELFGEGW